VIDLLVLGLIITIEPLPVIGFILVLSTDRGLRNGLAFIGAWVACLVSVILLTLLVTGGNPPAKNTSPALGAAIANVVIGVLLLFVAWRVRRRPPDLPRKDPAWMKKVDQMSAWGAAGLGVALQPWPLVAAGATVVIQADVSTTATVVVLVLFCVLATSSMLTMEIYSATSPEAAKEKLTRLRAWVDRHRDRGIVILAASVGFWLAGKGVYLLILQKA
jgi:Na+/melibiose symporter-like transporter